MTYTHVLISRPQPEAGQLAERFADTNLVPVVIPAYDFRPSRPGRELDAFCRAPGRRLLVFTSKRAVEFGLGQLTSALSGAVEMAAIGPATAAALEHRGQTVSLLPAEGFTSEALLADAGLERTPGHALIVSAPGGRTALLEGLAEKGWSAAAIHVYQRVDRPPADSAIEMLLSAAGVISVWTSGNAMNALARQLPEAAWRKVCRGAGVVTSKRLESALRAHGLAKIAVAAGPGNESIFDCVLQLI